MGQAAELWVNNKLAANQEQTQVGEENTAKNQRQDYLLN
jgi:hypothetical protein